MFNFYNMLDDRRGILGLVALGLALLLLDAVRLRLRGSRSHDPHASRVHASNRKVELFSEHTLGFPCAHVRPCFLDVLGDTDQSDIDSCEYDAKVRSVNESDAFGLNLSIVLPTVAMLDWIDRNGAHPFMRACAGTDEQRQRLLLAHTLPPEHPMSRIGVDKPMKRCAVVGNSYTLLGSEFGDEIDAHDAVFRINWAPLLAEYADDIGTRVTHVVNNHGAYLCSRRTPPRSCFSDYPHDASVLSKYAPCFPFVQLQYEQAMPQRFFLVNPLWEGVLRETMRFSAHMAGRRGLFADESDDAAGDVFVPKRTNHMEVSTGMMAVFTALALCGETDVYGFGNAGRFVHNYWTKPRLHKDNFKHSFDLELHILRHLALNIDPKDLPRPLRGLPLGKMRLHERVGEFDWRALGANGTEGGFCAEHARCDSGLECTPPYSVCVNSTREKNVHTMMQEEPLDGAVLWRGLRVPVRHYRGAVARSLATHTAITEVELSALFVRNDTLKCTKYASVLDEWRSARQVDGEASHLLFGDA